MSFAPYLFFNGNCANAFERYHTILGGDLQVMKMGDLPEEDRPEGAEPHHVMHAMITLGDGVLMGSDDPTGDDGPKAGFSVSYSAPDPTESARVFEELSKDGEVTLPFEATFWSRGFGLCTDAYGIPWMIDTMGEP